MEDGRCADVDDVLPDGFKIRRGDGVYYIAYAMGRMPYIWGEDARILNPKDGSTMEFSNLNHHLSS